MRMIHVLALFCAFGCSQAGRPIPADNPLGENRATVTIEDLVHVDASSSDFQHPLVCGAGRDFPTGRELAFRNAQSRQFVHAVFPEGIQPPQNLDGKVVLRGRYQAIQNREIYTLKIPPGNYRYFVVSSWERKN